MIDDTTVATIDTLGAVTAKIAGRTIATATVNGISGKAPITVVATAAELNTVPRLRVISGNAIHCAL